MPRAAVLALALALSACGSPSPAAPTSAATPSPAPSTATAAPPSPTATLAPWATATSAPTVTRTPAPTTPREAVTFLWKPGSAAVDSDDVDEIVNDLRRRPGILGGTGDDLSITLTYDPEVISPERIMAILALMGHPVVLP